MRLKKVLILVISCLILIGCSGNDPQKEAYSTLYIPPYVDVRAYTKSPTTTIPLGMYKIIESEGKRASKLFIGTDVSLIPEGTFLYLHKVGFRVAISDDKANGRNIVIYDKVEKKDVFIWAIIKSHLDKEDKAVPYILEL